VIKPVGATSPEDYIAQIDEPRRSDIQRLHELIREIVPDLEPHIHSGMLAYGHYHYKYASGREGDWFPVGLASQKQYISVYVCGVHDGKYVAESNAPRMPKANVGKSCIRFKRVADMDLSVLAEVIRDGAAAMPFSIEPAKNRA
jgi:hypothetical protein